MADQRPDVERGEVAHRLVEVLGVDVEADPAVEARAIATAIYSDPWALQQLWVFLLAPLVGAAIVGLLYRAFSSDDEFEVVEVVETIKD